MKKKSLYKINYNMKLRYCKNKLKKIKMNFKIK